MCIISQEMDPENKKKLKVLFVRHGQTEDNKSRTIAGHRPGKLTADGKKQAEKIGIHLAKQKREFDYIYVSDLGRTKQTFENASTHYPYLKNVTTVFTPMVRQRSGGILQGQPLSSWQQNAKKEGKNIRAYKCEGAESWQDVNRRASQLLKFLIEKHLKGQNGKDERIFVVTHGGFIMQFINLVDRIHGKQQKFDNSAKNCSMHQFQISYPQMEQNQYSENKVVIKYTLKNFVGHL